MRLNDRVESLKSQHAALDMAITEEARRLYPDNLAIKEMKRKKLKIKDELDTLRN